jgi:hypothetical protein
MKISQITEDNTPNIAPMMNGKPVQREAGRDPDHTKPYNKNNLVAKHSKQKGGTHKPAKGKGSYDRNPKHKGQDLTEAPIVTHGRSDLTDMIKSEFNHWIEQSHTVEELTKLMSAMGLTLKSDGERSVIGE